MVERHHLTEAARYMDAMAEELGGVEPWAVHYQVSVDGLLYVAQQRALRVALDRDGKDPTKLSRTEFTAVRITQSSRAEMPRFVASWIDGFATGLQIGRRHPHGS